MKYIALLLTIPAFALASAHNPQGDVQSFSDMQQTQDINYFQPAAQQLDNQLQGGLDTGTEIFQEPLNLSNVGWKLQ